MLKFAGCLHLHIWEHFLSASYSTIGRMSILRPLEIRKTVISLSKYPSTVKDYVAIAMPPDWGIGKPPKLTHWIPTQNHWSPLHLFPYSLVNIYLVFCCFFFQVQTLFCLRPNYWIAKVPSFFLTRGNFLPLSCFLSCFCLATTAIQI